MARILLALELGANLGHVGQLLPLDSALRARGHEVIFAARDVPRVGPLLRRQAFRCVQAPLWHAHAGSGENPPCSYSEILQHYGYRDPEGLLGLLTAWRELYALVDPKLVVCEFAPTALLACRGLNITRVQFGVGFSVPPKVTPLPSFRSWESVSPGRLEASDAILLDTANAARELSESNHSRASSTCLRLKRSSCAPFARWIITAVGRTRSKRSKRRAPSKKIDATMAFLR